VARDPSLRGRPVVTGQERGIVSAMTYEAKRAGIGRSMRISDVRKVCPNVVIIPSDYRHYRLVSDRLHAIARRHAPVVEPYSIDECFADLTGADEPVAVAALIKRTLRAELGMTFSVGVGPTKSLAKLGSKRQKPDGFTVIDDENVREALAETPAGKVWGIGGATAQALAKLGVTTALELTEKPLRWAEEHFSKNLVEIWRELRGESVWAVGEARELRQSAASTRTFRPPSSDRDAVFSRLAENVEEACAHIRGEGLLATRGYVMLKTQGFSRSGAEVSLAPTCAPQEVLAAARAAFKKIYRPGTLYRATGITLGGFQLAGQRQAELFAGRGERRRVEEAMAAVDRVNGRQGDCAVFLASSLRARRLDGGTAARSPELRFRIPWMGEVR
jgi:nucleotidyltransferase/DNA polymerase involved in DNA repair